MSNTLMKFPLPCYYGLGKHADDKNSHVTRDTIASKLLL